MKKMICLLLAVILTIGTMAGCGTGEASAESTSGEQQTSENREDLSGENEILSFRPVDCGFQSQSSYQFPFLGMDLVLPEGIRQKLDSREIFGFTMEDYTMDYQIAYAVIRFSTTTQEQREQEGMSVDILAFEESLRKLGAIGVYDGDSQKELDALTGCDTHVKLGTSADGVYAYYLSTSSTGDSDLAKELAEAQITLTEIHTFDPSAGYTAFSADRIAGIANLGSFTAEDVFGNPVTEAYFSQYDLVLVNIFTTWCSPCVNEMPELEKLRQDYADRGIRLGVLAIVLDARYLGQIDDGAVEQAKVLHDRSGVQFPFMIPDETELNGRLTGVESVPETFFVDGMGNLIGEPYVGARNMSQWSEIVDQMLAELGI